MNYNNCNGWNEYAGTYEGAYYAGDAAFARTAAAGGNCGSTAAAAAAGTAGSCGGTGRTCDLYWQGYMAGFYANNRCNQSAEARLPRQQTGPLRLQTAAAPAITAIIAVIGTIAAIAATAVLKNCRS